MYITGLCETHNPTPSPLKSILMPIVFLIPSSMLFITSATTLGKSIFNAIKPHIQPTIKPIICLLVIFLFLF